MDATSKCLIKMAEEEVANTLAGLADDLREHAERVTVVYDPWPSEALIAEGWDEDLLGMFSGEVMGSPLDGPPPLPPQIFLFYENLWDFSEGDEAVFRSEVRVTYLHELGHSLGLDEDEIDERGLL